MRRYILLLATIAIALLLAGGVALVSGLGGVGPRAAQAQSPDQQEASAHTSPDQRSATGVTPRSPDASRMLQKAEREGYIRAIVGLRTDFVPEGRLARAEVVGQQNGIDRTRAAVRADLAGTGYRTLREYETVPYVALELTPQAFRAVQNSPRVSTIQEDVAIPADLAESSPIVQAPTMWANGFDGAGKTIAILDTGVDRTHLFLNGKVVEEACYSASSNCPNGQRTQTGAGAGVPCTYAPEGCEHGTHVAGIAAGRDPDFSGVARGANVIAVQVFSRATGTACNSDPNGEDPCTLSFASDQIAGLERVYAVRGTHSIAAVNMSIGGGMNTSNCDTDARKAAIDNLNSISAATVISSGNNSFTNAVTAPGCISSAITVGSTTKPTVSADDSVAPTSNMSSLVDLLAPGVGINSSVPGGGFEVKSGTSMAAPHVAGAFALLEQKDAGTNVSGNLFELQRTGTPVTDTRTGGTVTARRINIAEAARVRPLNDDFFFPEALRPLSGLTKVSVNGINGAATRQSGEPDHLPTNVGSLGENSVWYRWEAPFSGQVSMDTCASSFDTILAVYTGSGVNSLSQVASDNDLCTSQNGNGSQLLFNAVAGTTYRVAVSGYRSNSEGTFTLNGYYTIPPNDNFIGAQPIGGASVSTNDNNLGATREPGEPDHLPVDPGTLPGLRSLGENSVWYRWEAPFSGQVSMDTCASSFDTILAVYTGSGVNSLSQVASDNDLCTSQNGNGSQLLFNVVAGTTYRIAVSGFSVMNGEGTFTLNVGMEDTTAPKVRRVVPAENATGIAPGANVSAFFSEAMRVDSVNTNTVKLFKAGTTTPIASSVSYDASTKKAVLNPNANLKRGAKYNAVVVGGGAWDLAGNGLDQDQVFANGNQPKKWSFTVRN